MSNNFANGKARFSKYVVKNLSSKVVRIFGVNILPGKEFDLLSVAGVSQNEIFSSVLKDDIGPRLRSTPPILQVTENTIDLISIGLSDADYTLDAVYFDFKTITFSGTLSTSRNVIFPNYGSTDNYWIVKNDTNNSIVVKTLSGAGVRIQTNTSKIVFTNGTDIIEGGGGFPALSGTAGNVLTENADGTLSFSPVDVTDDDIVGGFRTVADVTARNAIALSLREEGMHVYVRSTNETFKLGSGLTNSDWLYSKEQSSVANLAELVALNDAEYTNKVEFTVITLDDLFVLDKTSTVTADSITILNSLSSNSGVSAGRWIRKSSYSSFWFSQRTWYVDPSAGNDENTGASALLPLKTIREFNRRWWCHPGGGHCVINILSALPSGTDPPKFLGAYNSKFVPTATPTSTDDLVIFNGVATVVTTGSCTSTGTAADNLTNAVWTMFDTTKTWSTYIGGNFAIRFTSGSLNGLYCIPMKDLGSNQVLITNPLLSNATLSGITTTTGAVAPASGVTYEIVSFTDCDRLQKDRPGFDTRNPTIVYQYMYFSGSSITGTKFENWYECSIRLSQCIFSYFPSLNSMCVVAANACGFTGASGTSFNVSDKGVRATVTACGFNLSLAIAANGGKLTIASYGVTLSQISIGSGTLSNLNHQAVGTGTGTAFSLDGGNSTTEDPTFISFASTQGFVGSGWTNVIGLTGSSKVRLDYDAFNNGRYSITCSGATVLFNGFGYAVPAPQPAAIPLLQALQAVPTSTFNGWGSAPWMLPAIGSQMPVTSFAASMDGQANILFR